MKPFNFSINGPIGKASNFNWLFRPQRSYRYFVLKDKITGKVCAYFKRKGAVIRNEEWPFADK